jgi:hypothetical protein
MLSSRIPAHQPSASSGPPHTVFAQTSSSTTTYAQPNGRWRYRIGMERSNGARILLIVDGSPKSLCDEPARHPSPRRPVARYTRRP